MVDKFLFYKETYLLKSKLLKFKK